MADLFKYEEENLFKFEDGGDLFKYEDQPSQFKLDANKPVTGTLKSFVPETQPLVRESNVLSTKPIEPTIKNSPSTIYRSDNHLLNSVLGIPRALESGALQAAQAVTGAMYDVNPNAARERMRVLDERQQALRLAAGGQADYEQGAGSMAALAPLVAAGPGVMSVGAGVLAGGPAYQQAREKDIGPLGSAAYAAGQGGLEYATERIPLGIMFGQGGKGVIERLVKAVMPEITSEQIATLTQDALEQAVLNPEKSWDEYWNERGQAAVQTLKATVGGMGAAGAIMQAQQMLTPEPTKGEQFAQALQNEVNNTDLGAQNASQVQGPSAGMLRQERPQMGLQENGGAYAQPQEATGKGQAQEVMFSQTEQGARPRNALGQEIPPTQYELAHAEAQRNASLPVEQGGLGLPPNNTAMDRAKAMGISFDGVHYSRHGVDVNTLDSGEYATAPFDGVGTHIGTKKAALDRFNGTPDNGLTGGVSYPVKFDGSSPYVNQWGKAWKEGDLSGDLFNKQRKYLESITREQPTSVERKQANKLLRGEVFGENTHIPYINDVEDIGNISFIVPPKNIRSRFAAFDPMKRDSADLLASKGTSPTKGMTINEVITAITNKFGKKAGRLITEGRLRIVQSASDLPEWGKDQKGIGGAWDGKTAWIVADSMNPNKVIGAYLHEVGEHAGMRGIMGDNYQQLINRFNELLQEGDPIAVKADSRVPKDTRAGDVAQERIAYFIEEATKQQQANTLSEKAIRLLKDIIAAMRAWAYRKFGGVKLNADDFVALAKHAANVWADTQQREQSDNSDVKFAIVWHGSPHKFDKFDMSKIGTGEGAQAYGHGLYMAESPDVAVAYRNKLSTDSSLLNPKVVTFKDGSQVDVGTNGWALNMLKKGNMDAQEARAAIETELKDATYLKNNDAISKAKAALKALDEGVYEISGINAGALYKVDIPDEAIPSMLDYDSPISGQSEFLATLGVKQPANLKGSPNGIPGRSNLIGNGLVGESRISQELGPFNVNGSGEMLQPMLSSGENNQILNSVVGLDPVDMVNLLGGKQVASDMRGHNGAMLFDALPANIDNGVTSAVKPSFDNVTGTSARLATEVPLGGFSPPFGQMENLSTSGAGALNTHIPIINELGQSATGKDLYAALVKKLGSEKAASEYLAMRGVKGIRYLDGGSRGAGTGTYNYVLFDDQLPRILERNGVPTGNKPWSEDNKVMFSKEDVDELSKKFAFAIKGQADSRIQSSAEKAFLDNQEMFERMKRGVVSVKDSEEAGNMLAKEVGWSPDSIDQFIKDAGTQGVPPVEILAATMAMSRMQSLKLLEAQDPAEFLEYTADVLNTLMATRAYGSEMGRALQFIGAMERKGGYTPEQAKAQVPIAKKQAKQTADKAFEILKDKSVSHEDMKKALGGDKGIQKIMEAIKAQGKDIDLGMLVQYLSGVADGIIQAQKEDTTKVNSLMNMAMELFQANILTGVFTHEVNITSNLANMLMEFAFIQPVKGLVGGKKGLAGTAAGYKMLGGYKQLLSDIWALMKYNAFEELPASRLSHLLAQRDPTMIALMRGSEGSKWNDTKRKYIPGKAGKIIRGYGFVPLGVEDAIFKVIPFRFELARQQGAGETQDIAKAIRFAEEMTFQSKSEFAATVSRFTSKHPSTKPWLLFIKTMTNIMKRITELTPVAGQVYNKKELAGLEGKDAQQSALARMIVGWSLAAMLWGLIDDGEDDGEIGIIGYGPSERRKEALWKKAGNEQVALRIGEDLYPFYRLDPVAGFIGLVAAEKKAVTYTEAEKYDDAIVEIANGFYQAIMSKHFMVNVEETIGLMQDLIRYQKPQEEIEDEGKYKAPTPLDRVRRSMAKMGMSMVIPNIIPQIGDLTDEQKRKTRTIEDDLLRKFPVLRENLPEMLDVSGQPMEEPRYHSPFPINKKHAPRDEVSRWMMKLGRTLESDPVRLRGLDKDVRKELLQRRWDNVTLAYELSKDMPKDIQKDNLESALRSWSRESGRIVMMEELNKE